MHRLGRPSPPAELAAFPKAARLDQLARAGVPIPPGWVLLPPADEAAPSASALQSTEIDAAGPWIARMCLSLEDGESFSGAGLGLTLGDLGDRAALTEALERLATHARELRQTLPDDEAPPLRWALLVQKQIATRALAVCLDSTHCPAYLELHEDPGVQALDDGRTPSFAGPLTSWSDPLAQTLPALLESLRSASRFERGLDAELVHDGEMWWVVQSRPLVQPLFEDWPLFVSLLEEEGREALSGRWVADFEHNPSPLSFAHRWLLEQLRQARPGAVGEPRDFNGWLYLRTPLKEVAKIPADGDIDDARHALARLLDTWLPELRVAVESFEGRLAAHPALAVALDEALALFMTMGDRYQRDLMPARRLAARLAMARPTMSGAQPATLVDKSRHLEVLPIEWDIASQSLGDREGLRAPASVAPTLDIPGLEESEIAHLLGELDDHFFAWGLRPLRAFYLHSASRIGIDAQLAFELGGDELLLAAAHPAQVERWTELARARALLRSREGELEAPAVIVDGHPYPDTGQRQRAAGSGLRGVGIGVPVTGRLTHRPSLDALISDPPSTGEVVTLPALTAPAAWVLHRLGITSIVTEHGGAASHGSLMARELGISAIIGARGITRVDEGRRVALDTRRGFVRPLPETR